MVDLVREGNFGSRLGAGLECGPQAFGHGPRPGLGQGPRVRRSLRSGAPAPSQRWLQIGVSMASSGLSVTARMTSHNEPYCSPISDTKKNASNKNKKKTTEIHS